MFVYKVYNIRYFFFIFFKKSHQENIFIYLDCSR